MPLQEALAPAIGYAEDGFPVAPVTSANWRRAMELYKNHLSGTEHDPFFKLFAPNGESPQAGACFRNPDAAQTLKAIAESGARAFYEGEIAERIDQFAKDTGGLLRASDLAAFAPEWVEPLSVRYRGYDVWELPPNGQGIVALMAFAILEGLDVAGMSPETRTHVQIEAVKLAFSVGLTEIADPAAMRRPPSELLADDFIAGLRSRIGDEALILPPSRPQPGGTVYLCTADGEGNMVSFIQSNYMGFGSGIVVPGTGVSLQNRGHNFAMDPNHPNALAPQRRPYHTIIPGFLTQGVRQSARLASWVGLCNHRGMFRL
ncbi:hypothetical protein GCM10025858_17200 [Alicyclobacillus sacchari]|nr:hypothetical protein GCM10025858_17200 [Alicyclobacillus sacchari]